MNNAFLTVLSLTVSGSVIALLVLALQKLVRNTFSQRWHYYIWLVVLLRLLLPFSFAVNPIGDAVERIMDQPAPLTAAEHFGDETGESAAQPDGKPSSQGTNVSAFSPAGLTRYLWIVWITGAGILLVKKIAGYGAFLQYVKVGSKQAGDDYLIDVYFKVCEELNIKRAPALYKNDLMTAPMLVGIFRPFIVLPSIPKENANIQNILQHELIHYRRGDIFYKWLVQLAACVHWFNPLVYWISWKINLSCELSCDEALIRRMDEDQKYWYGETLLSTVRPLKGYTNKIVSVTLNEDADQLEERLNSIMRYHTKSRLVSALSVLLTLVLALGAMVTGVYAAPGSSSSTSRVFSVSNSGLYAEGGYQYNETFTLREAATIVISTDMSSDAGSLRFAIQSHNEDAFYSDGLIVDRQTRQPVGVLYQVRGQEISDTKTISFPAGKYYISIAGDGLLRNVEYEITGIVSATGDSQGEPLKVGTVDVNATEYLATSQVWQGFLQHKTQSGDKSYTDVEHWPEYMAFIYESASANAPGVGTGLWVQQEQVELLITIENVSGTMEALTIKQSNESPVFYLEDVQSGQYLVTIPPRESSYHIWFAISDYHGNILVENLGSGQ